MSSVDWLTLELEGERMVIWTYSKICYEGRVWSGCWGHLLPKLEPWEGNPHGDKKDRESPVSQPLSASITFLLLHLSPSTYLTTNQHGEGKSQITLFILVSFPSPSTVLYPLTYQQSTEHHQGNTKTSFLPTHNRIRSQLVLLKTLENKLDVSKHVFFRTFQSSCPNS